MKKQRRAKRRKGRVKLIVTRDGLKAFLVIQKPPAIQNEIDRLRQRFGLARWKQLIENDV